MKDEIQIIIIHVLDGTVSASEMEVFNDWFYKSKENKDLFFQIKHIYQLRGKSKVENNAFIIEESWSRLASKLHSQDSSILEKDKIDIGCNIGTNKIHNNGKSKFLSLRYIYSYAAILIGIIFFSLNFIFNDVKSDVKSDVKWLVVYNKPMSQAKNIILPDGSSVKLGAASSLKYPVKFVDCNRDVYLNGEATFEVVKKKGKKFRVLSKNQSIEVLGTRFNVMDYSGDKYSVTSLITGKIFLQTKNSNNEIKQQIVMKPNEQIQYNNKSYEVTLNNIDHANSSFSIDGFYDFYDQPLELIIQKIEKYYGVHFILPDNNIRKERYTGKFTTKQDIKEIVKIINFKKQFSPQYSGDSIILNRK